MKQGWFFIVLMLLVCSVPVYGEHTSPWKLDDLTGFPAPDFNLATLDGKSYTLADFRGRVIFLNFWTTWCPPCREEIPDLNELSKKYNKKDFVIVAISTDISPRTLTDFLKKYPVEYLVLHDPESKAARNYKAYSLPASFLIDRNGKIVERFLGSEKWMGRDFLKKIDSLL
ncbi:MAG: TlpA family protein disulfide reductase [bacterium]